MAIEVEAAVLLLAAVEMVLRSIWWLMVIVWWLMVDDVDGVDGDSLVSMVIVWWLMVLMVLMVIQQCK